MKRSSSAFVRGLVCFVGLVVAVSMPLTAASVNVKLATQAPNPSPWYTMLVDLGKRWEQDTDGRVSLTIYPGGVSGDESDIIRKMRIGQLHGGALTVAGLTDLEDNFAVFQIPLFFDDWDEFNYVLDDLTPTLIEGLDDRGFIWLTWGHVGWVHFFTKKPVERLDDLRKLKIFTWAGNDRMVQWWHANGFKPVALELPAALQGLKTGMIETMISPPSAAVSLQWYRDAPYMIDIGLAPMVGAVVLSKRIWNRIEERDRPKLLAAALEFGAKLEKQVPVLDGMALIQMKTQGLEVLEIKESEHSAEWLAEARQFADDMRGDMVPEEIFDRARLKRDEFRAAKAAEGGTP
jgi:TRAP-type C4-dicarboxylate transport system substrate-binding protein